MIDRLCLGVSRSIRGRKWTYRYDPETLESYSMETGLPLLQAAAQLIRWGRAIGYAFGLYVPDRVKEGYGPSATAFEVACHRD